MEAKATSNFTVLQLPSEQHRFVEKVVTNVWLLITKCSLLACRSVQCERIPVKVFSKKFHLLAPAPGVRIVGEQSRQTVSGPQGRGYTSLHTVLTAHVWREGTGGMLNCKSLNIEILPPQGDFMAYLRPEYNNNFKSAFVFKIRFCF